MKDISIDLSRLLPNSTYEMLADTVRVSSELELPLFIIGATVRDIIMKGIYNIKVPRATDDLDFGVAVETWEAYDRLKETLIDKCDFRQDDKQEQRLWRGVEKIDLVPYGGVENDVGQIEFPPNGDFRMSTAGFPEAFEDAVPILVNDSHVRIASLRGVVLLKFIAYNDRPAERSGDIQDILFIAENYLDAGADEKLYERESDLLDDEDFDYVQAGARILGRDLGAITTRLTREIIWSALDHLFNQYDRADKGGKLLHEIMKGLEERT